MGGRVVILMAAVVLLSTGCITNKSKYQWGGYEHSLYRYYKDPAKLDAYAEALGEAVADGQREDRVPPGLYAEYGFVLLTMGQADEARTYFELERQTWPESEHLMNIMIKNGSGGKKTAANEAAGGGEE